MKGSIFLEKNQMKKFTIVRANKETIIATVNGMYYQQQRREKADTILTTFPGFHLRVVGGFPGRTISSFLEKRVSL